MTMGPPPADDLPQDFFSFNGFKIVGHMKHGHSTKFGEVPFVESDTTDQTGHAGKAAKKNKKGKKGKKGKKSKKGKKGVNDVSDNESTCSWDDNDGEDNEDGDDSDVKGVEKFVDAKAQVWRNNMTKVMATLEGRKRATGQDRTKT